MARITIIFASTNRGKFDEFRESVKLDPRAFNLYSLKDLGYDIPECDETGDTFKENAVLKVRHTQKYLRPEHTEAIIIGDDSGMSIAALGGKPGVHTRRWVGRPMTDDEIISYCLDQLGGYDDRSAEYVTAYALIAPFVTEPYVIQRSTHGTILDGLRKSSYVQGIPFRGLFYIPEVSMMFHQARELPNSERGGLHIGHEEALRESRALIELLVSLSDIGAILKRSWTAATSYWPEQWHKGNSSFGQCAVSALVVQDILGGELIHCKVQYGGNTVGHFFNKLPGGLEADFTKDQFPKDMILMRKSVAERPDILRAPGTATRYEALKASFKAHNTISYTMPQ
jgi:XTP/dITP diphosphohydrolase